MIDRIRKNLGYIILGAGICLLASIAMYYDFTSPKPASSSVSSSAPAPEHSLAEAYIFCKPIVKDHLKSPSTAKFKFVPYNTIPQHLATSNWLVYSYVDSQNSFGAVVRTYFYCDVKYGDGGWDLISLDFDS